MNNLKKYFGIILIGLGIFTFLGGLKISLERISIENASLDDKMPFYIVLFVLLPIIVGGLSIMGWYALNNEYKTK
jgi:predicted Na+-dependent transporter